MRKTSFTLTEILVVVVIIAILATLSLPMFVKTIEKAKVSEAITNLNLIRAGEKIYFLQYKKFWNDINDLNIENPNGATSRYFNYTVEGANDTNFTAKAIRGDSGAQPAPSGYSGNVYTIQKDGVITGPLI